MRKVSQAADAILASIVAIVMGGLLVFAGCATEIIKPSDVLTPDDLAGLAETYCKANPTWPCGHVYLFPNAPSMNDLGAMELCVLDESSVHMGLLGDAESMYGASEPTPRHEGLCWWCCGGTCGPGCNAYDGCYCPPPPMPPPTDPNPTPPIKDFLHSLPSNDFPILTPP